MNFHFCSAIAIGVFVALRTGVVIPLAVASLVLIVVIPSAAWRGKLSVPIYALLALAAGVLAFATGRLAGVRTVHGTPLGVVISILFFLLVAAGLGCFLGMLFYRQPPEEIEPAVASRDRKPSINSSDDPDC